MHSIELKFSMYIIHHRNTYCIDLCEFRINRFFTGSQMYSYTIQSKESKFQNYASVQTVLLIKLKFGMCIVNPRIILILV